MMVMLMGECGDRQVCGACCTVLTTGSTRYFTTAVSGAGIFLPVHRAEKRSSPTLSLDSFPATPTTPSVSNNIPASKKAYTPPTPALPPKFSQSIGPGARPPSPSFKPRRGPSLPRPESPFRKQPTLAPTPARGFSQSVRGASAPRFTSSPAPKGTPRAGTARTPQPPRPYSRTGSRLGQRNEPTIDEDSTPVGVASTSNVRKASTGSVPSFSQPLRSPSRLGSAGGSDQEIHRLKTKVEERDRQLKEQAASLADMEASLKELSALLPEDGGMPTLSRKDSQADANEDGQTAAQLRQMLREKNEKISMLTAEFDTHRADFRSTIDTLELASSETTKLYEEQKTELLAQISELQDFSRSREDVESVARQLKQLEELVAELEEGLEDARRGEAEARGEVEFLRGEVERTRSELRRERDKSTAAFKNASAAVSSPKDVEQKDDEIRGLKAIIHSLSSTPAVKSPEPATNGHSNGYITDSDELNRLQDALEAAEREKEELRGLAERKSQRETELEKELESLRRDSGHANGHSRQESEMTATPDKVMPLRPRGDTIKPTFAEHVRQRSLEAEEVPKPFCEVCESDQHDTLECSKLEHGEDEMRDERPVPQREDSLSLDESEHHPKGDAEIDGSEEVPPAGKSLMAAEQKDEDKWCALCEKDGHLAFDCPEEQY